MSFGLHQKHALQHVHYFHMNIPSMQASSRSFFVVVDYRLLVQEAPGKTLDLGLLDQTMVVCGVVFPHGRWF